MTIDDPMDINVSSDIPIGSPKPADVNSISPNPDGQSADAVAWIEFTIQPELLDKHLSLETLCNPAPDQIVLHFALKSTKSPGNVEVAAQNGASSGFKHTGLQEKLRRTFRVLSLRVLAFQNWNVSSFSTTVPLHLLHLLLNELVSFSDEKYNGLKTRTNYQLHLTSKLFYLCWCIDLYLRNEHVQKPVSIPGNIQPTMLSDVRAQYSEEISVCSRMLADTAQNNVQQLSALLQDENLSLSTDENGDATRLPMHSSKTLRTHLANQNAPEEELKPMCNINIPVHYIVTYVNYIIGKYHFRHMEFAQAKDRFAVVKNIRVDCSSTFKNEASKENSELFKIPEDELKGLFHAVGLITPEEDNLPRDNEDCSEFNLERRKFMLACLTEDYRQVIDLLIEDNISRKLDFSARLKLAQNLAADNKAQLRSQVDTCNAIYAATSSLFVEKTPKSLTDQKLRNFYHIDAFQYWLPSLKNCSASEVAFVFMILSKSCPNDPDDKSSPASPTKSEGGYSDGEDTGEKPKTYQSSLIEMIAAQILLSCDPQIAEGFFDAKDVILEQFYPERRTLKKLMKFAKDNYAPPDVTDPQSTEKSANSHHIEGYMTLKRVLSYENEIIMESNYEPTRKYLSEYLQLPNPRPIFSLVESWVPGVWVERVKQTASNLPDPQYRSFMPLALGKAFRFLALKQYRYSHDWFMYLIQLTNQTALASGAVSANMSPHPMSNAFELEALNAKLNDLISSNQFSSPEQNVIQKCVGTIHTFCGNGSIFDVRSDILTTCSVYLLNCGILKPLLAINRQVTQPVKTLRLASLLAGFKDHRVKYNITKFDGCKEFFALVLDFHKSTDDPKMSDREERRGFESGGNKSKLLGSYFPVDQFCGFCRMIKDTFMRDCILTCLVRQYNVLNSENLVIELTSELLNEGGGIWRQLFIDQENLSNVNKTVSNIEMSLDQLLQAVLQSENGCANASWVKTFAELQMAKENYMSALRIFMSYGCAITNYFTKNNPGNNIWTDDMLKLMVRCCEKISYHVCAALFTQYMAKPEYEKVYSIWGSGIALLQAPCFFTRDAGDLFYGFISDKVILECIISSHKMRGEVAKMEKALAQMRKIDLNEFNPPQVKKLTFDSYRNNFCLLFARQIL